MTQAGEFTYRRIHRASRELLFDCMTQPAHLAGFWGPDGTTTPADGITVDLRPGGAFETVMVNVADGSRYTMRATYLDVRRPERIVWTEPDSGVTTTSTFRDLGGQRTELQLRQANAPLGYHSPEARAGFATSLDRFGAYLDKLGGSQ